MKIIIIGSILLLAKINFAYSGEWKSTVTVEDRNIDSYVNLKCPDSLNCIALRMRLDYSAYFFERTTDGGKTWNVVYTDKNIIHLQNKIGSDIREIAYPDTSLFIAVGDSGIMYRSTDKGGTWVKTIFEKGRTLYNLKMLDKNYGIMCAGSYDTNRVGGKLFETVDGGLNWTLLNTPFEFWYKHAIEDIQIIDRNTFIFLGYHLDTKKYDIVIVKNNWEEYYSYPTKRYFNNIYFLDEKRGWITGGKKLNDLNFTQVIEYTEDSGKTWVTQIDTFLTNFTAEDIDFFDENHGMVTIDDGLILQTDNSGKTWRIDTLINVPPGWLFSTRNIQFPSITTAFCIGDLESIYKYTRDWSVSAEESQNDGYSLQVYPNPASDNVSLAFSKGLVDFANIEITDIRGITIKQFSTNEFLYKMDVSDISPGLYLIKAKVKDKIIAKKLNIIR